MYIQPIADDQTDSRVAALYAADEARLGYVANYTRAFSRRPDVYAAWKQLNGAVRANMDPQRYELATMAAAAQLRSSYCMLAHGQALTGLNFAADQVAAVASDYRRAGLPEREVAIMVFAEKIARHADQVNAEDIEGLRRHGLSEDDILDVALAAAARCIFSKLLDSLGVQPDPVTQRLEPGLRTALTVGRPIADQAVTARSEQSGPDPAR